MSVRKVLTGLMLHNYYLYERDGKLGLLPWDYNAALGCFPIDGIIAHTNPADIVINQGIDTPLIEAKEAERPMWAWITRDEEYLDAYHTVMAQLIKEQIDSEKLVRELDRVQAMIRPYIEQDPTAFFIPQETENAYEALQEAVRLRAESIRRQLSGTLASRTEQQNPADRVDTSDIDLAVLKTGQKQ